MSISAVYSHRQWAVLLISVRYQLMLPIEENTVSRQAHHKGLQQLFQAIGPEGFIPVDTHKLFAGFRGSIVRFTRVDGQIDSS